MKTAPSETKLYQLFVARRLFDHLEQVGTSSPNHLTWRLLAMQRTIYALDAHFETRWSIQADHLTPLWHGIHASLRPFAFSEKRQAKLVSEIQAYQGLELALRDTCRWAPPPPEVCYRLKTCDVRLSRRIIGLQSALTTETAFAAWDIYDRASEVVDDVEDAEEDVASLNGNWLLLSIAALGLNVTIARYRFFLDTLVREAARIRDLGPMSAAVAHPLQLATIELAGLHDRFRAMRAADWERRARSAEIVQAMQDWHRFDPRIGAKSQGGTRSTAAA